MHGDEVAYDERPEQPFLAAAPGLGQRHQGKADRQALVAAAGIYHHGHEAAAHPRVAARRRQRRRAAVLTSTAVLQQHPAHIHAPFAAQALLGYGAVAAYLPLQQLALLQKLRAPRKVQDAIEAQRPVVRPRLVRLCAGLPAGRQLRTVQLPAHHVGVRAFYLHRGSMARALGLDHDVQRLPRVQQPDLADALAQQLQRPRPVFLRHPAQDVQPALRVAAHGADDGRGLYAAQPARAGHDDALDVFNNIAAAPDEQTLGPAAKCLARQRGGIGYGYRLRTAGGKYELVPEYVPVTAKLVHKHLQHLRLCLALYTQLYPFRRPASTR